MESGTRSGVMDLVISLLGMERVVGGFSSSEGEGFLGLGDRMKEASVGLLGLSSLSRTESRFCRTSSKEGRAWPKPCEAATCSIDLKY